MIQSKSYNPPLLSLSLACVHSPLGARLGVVHSGQSSSCRRVKGEQLQSNRLYCSASLRPSALLHLLGPHTLHVHRPPRVASSLADTPPSYNSPLSHSWHKVKVKTSDPTLPPAIGLVPASYLTTIPPLRTVTALYDYTPAVSEATGELENEEEMEITEGEQLLLLEEEDEWVLVQRGETGGVGFVPASYIEVRRSPG